jgi:ketosteroid isomerase-like protein
MKDALRKSGIVLLLAVSVVIGGLSLAQAQNKPESTTAKIMALENKWNIAYQKGDIAALNTLLADDFIITVEDGSTFSKPGYIAHSGDPDIKVAVSDMADLKIRLHGNVAVVTGAYHEKGTNKGMPYEYRDRLTDVWLNTGGNWQVIASHYSIPVKG